MGGGGGGDLQHLRKILITNGKVVAVKGIKTEDFLVKKYNKRQLSYTKTFLSQKKTQQGRNLYQANCSSTTFRWKFTRNISITPAKGYTPVGKKIISNTPVKGYTLHQLRDIHPLVRNLFPNVKVSNFPIAGRLQLFVKHWKKLTNNPEILGSTSGFVGKVSYTNSFVYVCLCFDQLHEFLQSY